MLSSCLRRTIRNNKKVFSAELINHICNQASSCCVQVERLPLKVSGSIPAWLHGDYIRNGPGTFKGMKHLFDGYGMLVKFSFNDGNVTTQQR